MGTEVPLLSGVGGSWMFSASRSAVFCTSIALRRFATGFCHRGRDSRSFRSARADSSRRFRTLAMLSVSAPSAAASSRTRSRMRKRFLLMRSGSSTASSSSARMMEADRPGPRAPTPVSVAVR